jgi:hypothetical protein
MVLVPLALVISAIRFKWLIDFSKVESRGGAVG